MILRRVAAIALAVVVVIAGCTSHADRPTQHANPSAGATPRANAVPTTATSGKGSGCGDTSISPADLPDWTADRGLPPNVPYAVSREGNVIAVLFGHPLRAGERKDGRSNKILWAVRDYRNGKPLHLTARPLAGGSPVSLTRQADSSGEVYPSLVDVPTTGCWRMTLEWNGHTATIDLTYGP